MAASGGSIDLSGQTAIVTGGSRGIGAAVCRMLAQCGAKVVVAYKHNHEAADLMVREIEALGSQGLALAGDLSEDEANETLFKRTLERFGAVNLVVGNAGIWQSSPMEDMTAEIWHQTIKANLDSTAFLCRHAAAQMKKQGGGKIILISSTAGQRGEPYYAHYAASKGAIIALARSLAGELGPSGIHVNVVAPGWVKTEMTAAVFADEDFAAEVKAQIPLRRIAGPEDIAGPVLFLASHLANHVQGAVINVNGGSVLS